VGRNVADLVRDAAAQRPDHEALVDGDRSMTWAEVDQEVTAIAGGLGTLGLDPQSRIALVLGNSIEFVVACFAIMRAGMVAVPLNPGSTVPELTSQLTDAGSAVAFCDDEVTGSVSLAAPAAQLVVVGGSASSEREVAYAQLLERGAGQQVVSTAGGEDLAVLLFTSGTGGMPKGAMLSHRALLANIDNVRATPIVSVTPDDRVLVVLPMFHIYTLGGTLAMVAAQAATAVIERRFDSYRTLRTVQDQRITNVPGAPSIWAAWSAEASAPRALAGLRMLFSGAAPLPPAVHEQIVTLTGLALHEGYGLTEAAPGVASTLASARARVGTVGRPLPGVEVRLLDEAGEPVDEGDPGEISIRGANLFSGYWPDGADGPDEDGWFNTGDVAYFDDQGDLVLVDRRKELVIVNGFNVYPREVEEALHELDGVAEAAVVGVPHPITGEAVKAYVVAAPEAHLTPETIRAHTATRLARFKQPTIIEIVDELPHSATGKVAKRLLRPDRPERRPDRDEGAA
jgi:long-chain acyl-CoA synthetase